MHGSAQEAYYNEPELVEKGIFASLYLFGDLYFKLSLS